MKFFKYLNESDQNGKNVLYNLKKSCSTIFSLYEKVEFENLFYRGYRASNNQKLFKYKTRVDRRPLDTPLYKHQLADMYFLEKFGWKARSEGLFATSDANVASIYGDYYIVFPADPFKFIYPQNVNYSDMADNFASYLDNVNYVDNPNIKDMVRKKISLNDLSDKTKNKLMNSINNILDNGHYTDNNLEEALELKVEVMFKCDYVYMIDDLYFTSLLHAFRNEIS